MVKLRPSLELFSRIHQGKRGKWVEGPYYPEELQLIYLDLLRRLEEEGLQKGMRGESDGNLYYCYENTRMWWTIKDG